MSNCPFADECLERPGVRCWCAEDQREVQENDELRRRREGYYDD